MGLTEIVRKIQEEANLESERVMVASREEVRRLREASQSEIRSRSEEIKGRLEKDKKTIWNMYTSESRRRSRHTILCMKEDLISETLSATRNRLAGMRGEELASKIDALLDNAKHALGADLIVNPARKLDAELMMGRVTLGPILDSGQVPSSVLSRFSSRDNIGGLVASSADGSRVLDMTFYGLMEKKMELIREEIARSLFEE